MSFSAVHSSEHNMSALAISYHVGSHPTLTHVSPDLPFSMTRVRDTVPPRSATCHSRSPDGTSDHDVVFVAGWRRCHCKGMLGEVACKSHHAKRSSRTNMCSQRTGQGCSISEKMAGREGAWKYIACRAGKERGVGDYAMSFRGLSKPH